MRSRRSVRRYTDQPVAQALIERVLTAATWAPSAHNRQPWRFVVMQDPQDKARLADAMGQRLRRDRLADGNPPALVEADVARSRARITSAPVVLVVCLTREALDHYADERRASAEYLMAVQSTAMAVQNILLAAHAEGLGACWMCAPLFCADTVRESLELHASWDAQALVTLGYPAKGGKAAARAELAAVTLWK